MRGVRRRYEFRSRAALKGRERSELNRPAEAAIAPA